MPTQSQPLAQPDWLLTCAQLTCAQLHVVVVVGAGVVVGHVDPTFCDPDLAQSVYVHWPAYDGQNVGGRHSQGSGVVVVYGAVDVVVTSAQQGVLVVVGSGVDVDVEVSSAVVVVDGGANVVVVLVVVPVGAAVVVVAGTHGFGEGATHSRDAEAIHLHWPLQTGTAIVSAVVVVATASKHTLGSKTRAS